MAQPVKAYGVSSLFSIISAYELEIERTFHCPDVMLD